MQDLNSSKPCGTSPRSYRGGYACGNIHRIAINQHAEEFSRGTIPPAEGHVPSPPPACTTNNRGATTHVLSHTTTFLGLWQHLRVTKGGGGGGTKMMQDSASKEVVAQTEVVHGSVDHLIIASSISNVVTEFVRKKYSQLKEYLTIYQIRD